MIDLLGRADALLDLHTAPDVLVPADVLDVVSTRVGAVLPPGPCRPS
ncbi:hypothetical protein ACI782_09625 [Geodermatophilus sp. SYSU D00703]